MIIKYETENIKIQVRKGVLEFCILSILQNEDAYANEMLAQLKDAELLVAEGTIYPLLNRLKDIGLLSYYWKESTSGPPRKYYALTETGVLFLEELNTIWVDFVEAVNTITSKKLTRTN